MAKIISLTNQKGGVAKTTSTFNIASSLALKNYRVLMIDIDPQASLTIYAGLEPYDYEKTIYDILKNPKQDISKCIVNLKNNLDIITSRIELSGLENELLSRTARELILSRALSKIKDNYDFIVIDCPPQLSTLTINALTCTDGVVIPTKTDYLSYRGLNQLIETIDTIKEYFKSDLKIVGILATMFVTRSKDDNDILDLLKDEYNVIGVIKQSVTIKQGIYDGLSIIEKNTKNPLSIEYDNVTDYIINNL